MIALVYAMVPKIACQGKCQEACGPIDGSDIEREYFEKRTGQPFPDALKVLESREHRCPMLSAATGRCNVYQHRPLICRLWGVAEGMPCPFGCRPERILTDREAHRMLDATYSL